MAIQHPVYQPTTSQQASAACHLDRRAEWRTVRLAGTRYVVMPSGTTGKTYWITDDAERCSCKWYTMTHTSCAHMIALRQANGETVAPKPRKSYADLFKACPCGDIADGADGLCYACAGQRVHAQTQRERIEAR